MTRLTLAPGLAHHRPITLRCAWLALAGIALGGCSSTPAPRFHSLLSTTEVSAEAPKAPAVPLVVELSPVTVPASVDQPQWVVRMPDDSLRILEQEQWVGPLREELREAVTTRLTQRFGAVDARHAVPPAAVVWRVKIDVQRFESIAGREAWLDSSWSLVSSAKAGPSLVCSSSVHESGANDIPALASAHRRAARRLADQIGKTLILLNQRAPNSREPLVCADAS